MMSFLNRRRLAGALFFLLACILVRQIATRTEPQTHEALAGVSAVMAEQTSDDMDSYDPYCAAFSEEADPDNPQ